MPDQIPIRTPRLVLREFVFDDFEAVDAYAKDPEVARFTEWGPNSALHTLEFIRLSIEAACAEPRTRYTLAVTLPDDGTLIGACELSVEPNHREGSVGYTLRRDQWGNGYATETVRALCEFGFGPLGLHRVCATSDVLNVASWRVMEKLGMKREGHLREHLWLRDRWRDSYLYSVLDREWIAQQGESMGSHSLDRSAP
jgi:ribosomal-protein-alanine N-acetyltransferase